MRNFLEAEWRHLLLLNYPVPENLLSPYLPAGCELDRWEGQAYVSLVAFQFLHTRVLGVSWPGFRHFPEVNLRFYVRQGSRRGVAFIREYVPSRWVAFLARALYNEPYASAQMGWDINDQHVAYWLRRHGKDLLQLTAEKAGAAYMPAPDSLAHFFKEHDLGFGRNRAGETTLYRVTHPHWQVWPVTNLRIAADWSALYGPQFAFLKDRAPQSAVLAVGSSIEVGFLGDTVLSSR